jgi:hypothetical protein
MLNTKRLLKLIAYMDALPKSAEPHFNMRSCWARHQGPHPMTGPLTKKSIMDCGTTACALGWAATIPEFRRAGLRMEWYEVYGSYEARFDSDKAAQFFGLDGNQFWSLFNDNNMRTDTTPKNWAKRAREQLREWTGERTAR